MVRENKRTWSFTGMVEIGRINRENHQLQAKAQTQKREKSECSFRPELVANRLPREQVLGDRAVFMYEKAMSASKLVSKNRSDRDPLDIEDEKSFGECYFHPKTNHNTHYGKLLKDQQKKQSPSPKKRQQTFYTPTGNPSSNNKSASGNQKSRPLMAATSPLTSNKFSKQSS